MKKRLLPVLVALVLLTGCGKTDISAESASISEATVEATVEAASEDTSEIQADQASSKTSDSESDKSSREQSAAASDSKSQDQKDASAEGKSDSKSDSSAKGSSAQDKSAQDSSAQDNASKDNSAQAEAASNATTSAASDNNNADTANNEPQIIFPDEETKPAGYGRIIFTGDSRTVDMFYGDRGEIWGETFDGIPVFCRDACQSDYMMNAVNSYGIDNFDTLVTWMGCNDYGNFGAYEGFYNSLLQQGKNIVVCTVGPTDDSTLANDFDREYYTNDRQIAYNNSLVSWANNHGVKVIDLYSYISGNGNLYISPEDGIHYMPQPTSEIWYYILSNIR